MLQYKTDKILRELGENIKLARLRRKLSTQQVAERAGIGRRTLYEIEKGKPTVGIGNYAYVLSVLGLESDLLNIAKDDILGRKLQDAKLTIKGRAPKRKSEN
ncbi:MAG: helix-turn-helix domain-containing protein [Ignavibacteriaceae bacterium]|jgi:transcriptional regulator with XRE-family HTH domain|nr:helix-turn-helix domain-containing protein [Ignavibacteriaceae bacterium]